MGSYPVVLELRDRPVLVVGGGAVAERKVDGLLQVGDLPTVVSPTLTERLEAWARESRIRWIDRSYRHRDVAGHALVFVATDDAAVNAEAAGEARARGTWVNAADDPPHCEFTLPSPSPCRPAKRVRRSRARFAGSSNLTSPMTIERWPTSQARPAATWEHDSMATHGIARSTAS